MKFSMVLVAFAASGCSIARLEAGPGLGIGAVAKVPGLVHAGFGVGEFENYGWHYQYGDVGRHGPHDEFQAHLLVWHWEGRRGLSLEDREAIERGEWTTDQIAEAENRLQPHHACFSILPPLTSYGRDSDGRTRDPWSLELGLFLGVFDIVLGANPLGALP